MNYEIHITLQVANANGYFPETTEDFRKNCEKLGVKPILIETQNINLADNHQNAYGQQFMTSSKYTGEDYKETLEFLSFELGKKYEIIRQKIEIQPELTKNPEHIYYETHLRLKLRKNNGYSKYVEDIAAGWRIMSIKNLCKKYNFHFSKNLFKQDKDFAYQMITYRNNNISLDEFNLVINKMSAELVELNKSYDVKCDKIEIEECIYDSNINVDSNWLKN